MRTITNPKERLKNFFILTEKSLRKAFTDQGDHGFQDDNDEETSAKNSADNSHKRDGFQSEFP